MKTSDFDYDLPENLIAQTPLQKRDSSRLFVYHRKTNTAEHKTFLDIIDYLDAGEGLVVNDTKVIPARLFGVKETTGTKVEFLLLNRLSTDTWEVILKPGRRLHPGTIVWFDDALKAEIIEKKPDGITKVQFYFDGVFEDILNDLGHVPLPPYIKEKLQDKTRYQTVYAKDEGSAAAPTAGLHFTADLLQRIKDKGIHILPVTLHVGLATFRPVKAQHIEAHEMHAEFYSVSEDTANTFNNIKKQSKRIIAVGTTSVRVVESIADKNGLISGGSGWTDIFIYPGYTFIATDAMVTNFHLPKSTLLMLISAFMGRENTLDAYRTAVEKKYRFFSFGDAMYID